MTRLAMKNFFSFGRFGAFLLSLGIFALLPGALRGQGIEGVPVSTIEVRYVGPETISKDQILANMKTKVGSPYSETTVEDESATFTTRGKSRTSASLANPQRAGCGCR